MSTPIDSNPLRDGKRINPRPRRAARAQSVVRAAVIIMQLNVEGLTKAKCAILEHLMEKHKATAIVLQKTHSVDLFKLKIFGYNLVACTNSSITEQPHL